MRLENDLAIRRQAGDILPDDVALGVGVGWHCLVGKPRLEIRDVTDEKTIVRQIKERRDRRSIFTDATCSFQADMQRVVNIASSATETPASIYECADVTDG
ncbi:hypothetical protein QO002_001134 [Pararhizobium capsulatum DSM 1112]|uniref:Uncharacterized protein n=1 Tax=Pararhizobium capsulatum DSM 1112 TaxID=1121113 RepID=A0ABU0BMU7_9HYPH|nr:hypothetical protein [Pararhizobium capsulatum]MDQ0318996.1 hypothetical protein [Pararhizobium capsulatum DSM 1112]